MLKILTLLVALLVSAPALAASGTIYVDTGGCNTGSTTQCSGTTNSATATASGAAATITCSATSGPSSGVGCTISGSAGQLSGVSTAGDQALIIQCATNANSQKIFWINAVDNVGGTVGTTQTPTGCTSATSDWGIGGRYIWPTATAALVQAALRAGDTLLFRCTSGGPAIRTGATALLTTTSSGDQTNGFIKIMGDSGCRPLLQASGTAQIIAIGGANTWISNLELKQTGTAASAYNGGAQLNQVLSNIKISQSPVDGVNLTAGSSFTILNSEITGAGGHGINGGNVTGHVSGSYIHNNIGDGILASSAGLSYFIADNIIASNGKGIVLSGAPSANSGRESFIINNTIYNNGSNGLEVANANAVMTIQNNIFQQNGGAAGFNVAWLAGTAELGSYHSNNLFWTSSCGGGAAGKCLSNVTDNYFSTAGGQPNTEVISDALFNGAGSGDFSLAAGSPARNAAFPGQLLGATTAGALAMGAMQPAAGAAGNKFVGN